MKRKLCALLLLTFVLFTFALPVYASVDSTEAAGGTTRAVTQEAETDADAESSLLGDKAIACGIAISFAAGLGALGMGIATGKAAEGISRQPCSGADVSERSISLCSCGATRRPSRHHHQATCP